ncbi:molybdopterin-guanine dinucleotide biosynthesis protein B [Neobacillus mesonae]|uniref:molybdopterin-guanine dinucleotide biosynthesis protein B n=1 Tax=Neobacillus mesonae TaxID=1193713 RepID=UPI00203AA97F|nr:molybdopterin-guanine dinucleotide biosynthesis protein B [Neobacillus mesonae]MCM3570014.1 molybdopterin-guanine dinucleotide biosynthesis protein B [Neobacillus mesonae]
MALVKPFVFQVTGFQNSGKTTLINKLIQELTETGKKITVIKHHGHGGKPDISNTKDSAKYINSGAAAAIVEGDGRLILQAEGGHYSLEEQVRLLQFFQPDIILIEGYKFMPYPKIVMIKETADIELLRTLENVKAVVYWQEEMKENILSELNVPCFCIYNESTSSYISRMCTEKL